MLQSKNCVQLLSCVTNRSRITAGIRRRHTGFQYKEAAIIGHILQVYLLPPFIRTVERHLFHFHVRVIKHVRSDIASTSFRNIVNCVGHRSAVLLIAVIQPALS